MFYSPWRQDKEINSLEFYVRSALPAKQMALEIRRVMAGIDRDLPLEGLRTLDEQIRLNIQTDRIVLQLAAVFAVLATALAMLGLYGVMAHSVTRRTREIGIRMALGAEPGKIRGMVMRELLWILIAGLVTGVPAALLLARYTETQLYGVKARDVDGGSRRGAGVNRDGDRRGIPAGAPGVARQSSRSAALRVNRPLA